MRNFQIILLVLKKIGEFWAQNKTKQLHKQIQNCHSVLIAILVVLLGCLGRCLCCWSPAVVTVSGFAARMFGKDPNDPNNSICYLPTLRLVMLMPNAIKFNFQTNVVVFLLGFFYYYLKKCILKTWSFC